MKTNRRQMLDFLAENGFIIIFALWCLFLSISAPNFLTVPNVMTLLRQASIIGIVAIGEAMIVLSGAGMDVSLASILGLSGVVASIAMVNLGVPLPLAVLAGIALGATVGLVNGVLVTGVRINGIVVTLGMMTALEGAAFMLTRGQTIFGAQLGPLAPLSSGYIGPAPLPVLILFAFYAMAYYIANYTVFGARVYAIGCNEQASRLAGINVGRLRLMGYVAAGALAGFGGIMQTARMNAATGGMGQEFLFPILTAVILGGVSLQGGRGKILNVLVAAVFLSTITNGLVLLGVPSYAQKIISGVILVLALSLDSLRSDSE
ncbi:MAG TPA: ABC transporter permease [bacterium]|nr:ABC transporter permease [bacterium]